MCRRVLAILTALLLVVGLPVRLSAGPHQALMFPPGWNLVAGPTGSRLVGATGSIYSLQPGDASYELLPSDAPLKSGWDFWAYFPGGGSLIPATDTAAYAVTLAPGQWAM